MRRFEKEKMTPLSCTKPSLKTWRLIEFCLVERADFSQNIGDVNIISLCAGELCIFLLENFGVFCRRTLQ